jgi:hypothetical protein
VLLQCPIYSSIFPKQVIFLKREALNVAPHPIRSCCPSSVVLDLAAAAGTAGG